MGDYRGRGRAAGINKLRDAWSGKALWIRTELTCSTRRAVTRILEVADEVVMLERSGDEEDRIERNPRGKKPPASSPGTNCHTLRCYAYGRAGTTSRRIDPTVRPRRQTVHSLLIVLSTGLS